MTFSKEAIEREPDPEYRQILREARTYDDFGLEVLPFISAYGVSLSFETLESVVDALRSDRSPLDVGVRRELAARGLIPIA